MFEGETAGCTDRKQRPLLSAYRGRVQLWRLDQRTYLVFICRREHFRHNCTPIFSPFLKNVVPMLDNVRGKKVGSDPSMLDGSNLTALLETRPREHKMML